MSDIKFYEEQTKEKEIEIEKLNNKIDDLKIKIKYLNESIEHKDEVINYMKEEIKKAIDELKKVGFIHGANSKERALIILNEMVIL